MTCHRVIGLGLGPAAAPWLAAAAVIASAAQVFAGPCCTPSTWGAADPPQGYASPPPTDPPRRAFDGVASSTNTVSTPALQLPQQGDLDLLFKGPPPQQPLISMNALMRDPATLGAMTGVGIAAVFAGVATGNPLLIAGGGILAGSALESELNLQKEQDQQAAEQYPAAWQGTPGLPDVRDLPPDLSSTTPAAGSPPTVKPDPDYRGVAGRPCGGGSCVYEQTPQADKELMRPSGGSGGGPSGQTPGAQSTPSANAGGTGTGSEANAGQSPSSGTDPNQNANRDPNQNQNPNQDQNPNQNLAQDPNQNPNPNPQRAGLQGPTGGGVGNGWKPTFDTGNPLGPTGGGIGNDWKPTFDTGSQLGPTGGGIGRDWNPTSDPCSRLGPTGGGIGNDWQLPGDTADNDNGCQRSMLDDDLIYRDRGPFGQGPGLIPYSLASLLGNPGRVGTGGGSGGSSPGGSSPGGGSPPGGACGPGRGGPSNPCGSCPGGNCWSGRSVSPASKSAVLTPPTHKAGPAPSYGKPFSGKPSGSGTGTQSSGGNQLKKSHIANQGPVTRQTTTTTAPKVHTPVHSSTASAPTDASKGLMPARGGTGLPGGQGAGGPMGGHGPGGLLGGHGPGGGGLLGGHGPGGGGLLGGRGPGGGLPGGHGGHLPVFHR